MPAQLVSACRFWPGCFWRLPCGEPQQRATHGDARFASKDDLAATGMLKPVGNGIVVGKMGGDLIRLAGTRHVLLSAPTRSGKGVGAVIPNLLTFEDSIVVLDIKQEAFDLTSGWRQQYGPVYLFNPFAEDLRTDRWNPLSYVKRDPRFRITDLQAIAAILYEDDPHRDAFWTNQARNAFLAASLYLWESYDQQAKAANAEETADPNATPPAIPTLGQVYRLFSGDGQTDLKTHLSTLAQQPHLSRDCKTAFANLTALAEQTFTSVIGSFQEPLHIFLNPILDAATSADDFHLDDLRKKRMTIYVGITPNKLAEAKKLLNLFFSQVININTQALPEKDPTLKHQCLLLLDEFTSISRVDIIAHAISYLAGYNVRVFCVIQSLSQLDATYGAEVARTMVTNLACQIVYTPREQRDANEYSEMLGYTTLRRRNRTRSHGQGGSVSYAEVEERRALMLPQELKALSPEQQIIFVEGAPHPIKCSKIRYYQDAFFKQRLKPKAAVSTLELQDTEMKLPAPVIAAVAAAGLAACTNPSPSAAQNSHLRDGYHPTTERVVPCEDPSPRPEWTGFHDQPVEACLGPNKFMIPMHYFTHQAGPDFQGSIGVSLRWPTLEPLSPGEAGAEDFFEKHSSNMIDVGVDYIDRIPIKNYLPNSIKPQHDFEIGDPAEDIDLRIKGEVIYGLTPYYADLMAIKKYLMDNGYKNTSHENIVRNGDDWYLAFDAAGEVSTMITCDNREIPGTRLIDGQLEDTQPGVNRGMCDHAFVMEKYKLIFRASYLRAYLQDWKRIEDTVRDLFEKTLVRKDEKQ